MHNYRRSGGPQPDSLPYQATIHRPGQKEKTERAFKAYMDLLEAAEWIRNQVRGQFEIFGLTFREFQIMEMLERNGTMRTVDVAERCRCNRQNIDLIVARLVEMGYLLKQIMNLPPAEVKQTNLPKDRRGKTTAGRKIAIIGLSKLGRTMMKNVLKRHKKVVKAFFRALDGREQTSLSTICQKLILGDPMKFISELEHVDVE